MATLLFPEQAYASKCVFLIQPPLQKPRSPQCTDRKQNQKYFEFLNKLWKPRAAMVATIFYHSVISRSRKKSFRYQGLTQAEIALCLSFIQISTRHLRRRRARLRLYR